MKKFALLGAWHVHTEGFLYEAIQTGLVQLSVVWEDNVERGKAISQKYKVPFEPNLDKALHNYPSEFVMVECATTKHKEVIIQAANARKHIFTDKALALTTSDCLDIKQSVEKNNVKFAISLESKEIGAYRYAKQLVDEGRLGRITSVYFRRTHQAALDKNMLPSYWFDPTQTGGGVTLDLGCHGLYLLPHFCGEPKKVSCLMNELYDTGSDENSTTIIEFKNGAIGTSHTSFVSYQLDNLLEIIGTEGSLVITGNPDSTFRILLQSKHIPGHETLFPVSDYQIPNDKSPIGEFIKMLSSESETSLPFYNIECAIQLTRLIECAYQSSKQQKVVFYN